MNARNSNTNRTLERISDLLALGVSYSWALSVVDDKSACMPEGRPTFFRYHLASDSPALVGVIYINLASTSIDYIPTAQHCLTLEYQMTELKAVRISAPLFDLN